MSDLVPVRRDQSSADAVAAAVSLAPTADRLGIERFWLPEHHNGATASTSASVLVSILAGASARIRVGAGGVSDDSVVRYPDDVDSLLVLLHRERSLELLASTPPGGINGR